MFTPEYLNELVEKSYAAATEFSIYLTDKVIDSVVNLFEQHGEIKIIPSNVQRLKQLNEQSGILVSDIEKEIRNRLPGLDKKIREAFLQAGYEINEDINKSVADMVESDKELKSFVGKAPRIEHLTESEKKLLDAAYKRTSGEIRNLTRTTAADLNRQFMKSCDSAWWKATHGVDKNTAIREAISEVSKYGTHVIYRRNGKERKMTVEAATRMCVLTGINQANAQITLSECANAGLKTVLVSSHIGARYTDKDEPANHMSWQGKIYSISDSLLKKMGYKEPKKNVFGKIKDFFKKFRKQPKYPDLEEVTGYGTVTGLCGANCRHTIHMHYPGNSNPYKEYDNEENKKKYDFFQKQRAMERRIRETKKRLYDTRYAIKALTDKDAIAAMKMEEVEIKALFDKQFGEYERFCKQNSLHIDQERLYVGNQKYNQTVTKSSNSGIIKLSDNEQRAMNRYISSDSYPINDKLRRGEKLSEGDKAFIKDLDSALDKMPEYKGIVYRSVSDFGIEDVDAFIKSHTIDSIQAFPSYISTSKGVYDKSFPIQYVIQSNHGKDISSLNVGEQEILFKRNSKFIVNKIEGNTIYMEEL